MHSQPQASCSVLQLHRSWSTNRALFEVGATLILHVPQSVHPTILFLWRLRLGVRFPLGRGTSVPRSRGRPALSLSPMPTGELKRTPFFSSSWRPYASSTGSMPRTPCTRPAPAPGGSEWHFRPPVPPLVGGSCRAQPPCPSWALKSALRICIVAFCCHVFGSRCMLRPIFSRTSLRRSWSSTAFAVVFAKEEKVNIHTETKST